MNPILIPFWALPEEVKFSCPMLVKPESVFAITQYSATWQDWCCRVVLCLRYRLKTFSPVGQI